MRLRNLDVATLRAAWWTWSAARSAARQLGRRKGIDEVRLPEVPALPDSAGRGVAAVFRRRRHSCIVEALVWQTWHQAHGSPRDLIVGVTAPGDEFQAHAWLDGDPAPELRFHELLRRPAR
jgi:hypothetical protein